MTGVALAGRSLGKSVLVFALSNAAMIADATLLPPSTGSYLAALIFVPWGLSGVLTLFWTVALAVHVHDLRRDRHVPSLPGIGSSCPCGANYCEGCRRGRWLREHR